MRSIRRTLLDRALDEHRHLMQGRVLDVGGKKIRKRGLFRPDTAPADSWEYLNVDPDTEPDIVASADAIPLADASVDAVVLAEVLQHVLHPEAVLAEIGRVLRPDGRLIGAAPLLHPIHRDPDDYQRWPPTRVRLELERAGLEVEELSPMGSLAAVVYDLCWAAWSSRTSGLHPLIARVATTPFALAAPIVLWFDARLTRVQDRITTGYFFVATRSHHLGAPGSR